MKKFHVFFILFLFISVSLFAQTAQELRLGGVPVSGFLNPGTEFWYSVRAASDGFLIVETTGDTDTYLQAYDDRRNLLMENDDGGEGLNARIEMFVNAGRTYLFRLTGFGGHSTGQFRIWASSEPIPAATELRFGQELHVNLTPGVRHWYRVRSTSAGYIVVETDGTVVDTYMYLYDSRYNLLMQDDDSGMGLNARIEILAEPNQTYFFVVRGFHSESIGPYSIWANFEPIPPDTARNTERARAVPVRLGEAMPVHFRALNESRWFRFDATRNRTVFVVQTRGDLETTLILYDSDGYVVAEDSWSGEWPNGLIHTRLNAGTYFIEVRTYSNGAGVIGRCTLHAETR